MHGEFDIVHLNVYVDPAVPLNVDVGLDELPNDPPIPLTIDHKPVPTDGLFPAKVTVVTPQVEEPVWSAPAFDVLGFWLNVITTSSLDAVHGEFDIVHLNVYVDPAVPLNVDVGLDELLNVPPLPLTIDHKPVPTDGLFPAKVTVVSPQVEEPVWSTPALAIVVLHKGFNASKIAPHFLSVFGGSLNETVPLPTIPTVDLIAHAAPIDSEPNKVSYISVKEPGDIDVFQLLKAPPCFPSIIAANIITAAFELFVEMLFAVAIIPVLLTCGALIEPGVTSKGPKPAITLPGLNPPVTFTFAKATIAAAPEFIFVPMGHVNV